MSQTKAQLISDLVQALNFTGTATAPANGLFLSATNTLKLSTASTPRLTINSDGHVDVVGNLDVGAGIDVTGDIIATGDITANGGDMTISGASAILHLVDTNDNPNYRVQNIGGSFQIYDATSDVSRLSIGTTEIVANDTGASVDFRVEGDGATNLLLVDASSDNVGINTSSPGAKLDVAGDIRVKSSGVYKAGHSGSASAPLYTTNDADTGMFSGGSNQLAFATGTDEAMRIDASQRLLIGHTSSIPASSGSVAFSLQLVGTGFSTSTFNSQRYENGQSGASILLNHSRGTVGNHSILLTNDELGKIRFYGSDGNDFDNYGVEILAEVDASPGNNAMPGRLIFKTTTTGNPTPAERMRIDSQGRVKIAGVDATISNHALGTTHTPLYLQTVTDLTSVGQAEGSASTGLFRMYDVSTNTDRYHGIELRNKSNGDIRILNQDRNTSDRGDLVIAMPQAGNSGGIQEKIRISGLFDSLNIAGKGGATLLGPSDSGYNKQKTDVYISTKTGVTAINSQAGDEVAGLIRFEEVGSSNNRFHGIELRNKNSGDVRILNKDIGASNKADLVFAVDNGSDIVETARFLNTGGLAFGGETTAAHALDDYEEGTHIPTMANLDVPSHVTVDHFNFTKVGRLVHFNAKFSVSGSINDVSGFGFTLPFTQAGSRENVFTAISDRSGSNTAPFALVLNANQSTCYAKELDGFSSANYNSFSTNVVLVTGTYESN